MNEENRKYIWKYIQKTGDHLLNKLPEHPNHPNGRNPYAHICLLIKNSFQESYRDIPDEKLNELVSFIKNIRD